MLILNTNNRSVAARNVAPRPIVNNTIQSAPYLRPAVAAGESPRTRLTSSLDNIQTYPDLGAGFFDGIERAMERQLKDPTLLPGEIRETGKLLDDAKGVNRVLGPISNAVTLGVGLTSDHPIENTICAGFGIVGSSLGGAGGASVLTLAGPAGTIGGAMAGGYLGGEFAEGACHIGADITNDLWQRFAPQDWQESAGATYKGVEDSIKNFFDRLPW